MFLLPGHGTIAAPSGGTKAHGSERAYPAAAACGFTNYDDYRNDHDVTAGYGRIVRSSPHPDAMDLPMADGTRLSARNL